MGANPDRNPQGQWHALEEEAELVFQKVASIDGNPDLMSKAELVRAYHGDFKVFEDIDGDSDGNVTLDEWHAWLQRTHASKEGAKGDRWLKSVLHTLSTNLASG